MTIYQLAKRAAAIFVLCLITTPSLADPMTGEELLALYSKDVTECGSYMYSAKLTPYCEHWRQDGTIVGKDHMMYRGNFHIKADDALVCKRYGSSSEYCVPIVHVSGDTYTTTFGDGSQADVTIVEGDTKNLR